MPSIFFLYVRGTPSPPPLAAWQAEIHRILESLGRHPILVCIVVPETKAVPGVDIFPLTRVGYLILRSIFHLLSTPHQTGQNIALTLQGRLGPVGPPPRGGSTPDPPPLVTLGTSNSLHPALTTRRGFGKGFSALGVPYRWGGGLDGPNSVVEKLILKKLTKHFTHFSRILTKFLLFPPHHTLAYEAFPHTGPEKGANFPPFLKDLY